MSDVTDEVKGVLRAEFPDQVTGVELTDDLDLLNEDIIDSLGIFLLVEALQAKFGVTIEPEEVTIENFETIGAISKMVSKKQSS